MDMIAVLKHLISQEVSLPALKLIWDNQVDIDDLCELPKVFTKATAISNFNYLQFEHGTCIYKKFHLV